MLIKTGGRDFLSTQKVRIGLRLYPLIKREVIISEFAIVNPKITIERDDNGRFNFEGSMPRPAKEEKLPAALLTMGSFVISGGDLSFQTGYPMLQQNLTVFDLNAKDLSFSGKRSPNLSAEHRLLREVSMRAIKTKDFEVRNVQADMKGKDGIFDISPIVMNFFGEAGEKEASDRYHGRNAL